MTYQYKPLIILLIFFFLAAFRLTAQDNPEEYRKTIEMADNYFSKGDYINAKASYQIAVKLAPNEQYPKDRLQQSLDMIKVQMYQNSLYTQKILVADDLFNKKDFENALKYYQEALTILPGDVYASGKIQEINRTNANNQQIEADYQKSITTADKYYKEGKLENALNEYRNALSLKPGEAYPKGKAIEIEALIAKNKKITDEYELAMQDAELLISRNNYDSAIVKLEKTINLMPGDPLPKQKLAEAQSLKAAWDSYSNLITAADELYVAKDFEKAKQKYLQALSVKPADEYPKSMIDKIDLAILEQAAEDISSYEEAIQLADQLFSEEKYEQAMVEYQNALRFKPDEPYAKQRINDITNALNLRKSQEEAYTQAIAKGDKLYREGQFSLALAEYNKAMGFKPLEQYPKVKIAEINEKLANLATQQEIYNNLIKGADKLFFTDNYFEALGQYKKALEIFPDEKYPQEQIIMINEILGLRDKYNASIARAEQLYKDKDYEAAILEFKTASSILPTETYPQEKIKELETVLARNEVIKNQQEEEKEEEPLPPGEEEVVINPPQDNSFEIEVDTAGQAEQKRLEAQYQEFIGKADNELLAKDYKQALADYQQARTFKPGEVYAERKIAEINTILADIAAKEAAAKAEAERIAAEKEAAAKAEAERIAAEKEAAAKAEAERIAAEKEAAAKAEADRIAAEKEAAAKAEADRIAAEKEAAAKAEADRIAAEKEAAAKAEADRIAAEKAAAVALDKEYNAKIESANGLFNNGQLEEARTTYQEATELKPAEELPKKQVIEIDRIMKEKAAELDQAYLVAISKADNFFALQDYEMAKLQYARALELKPGETYPAEKLKSVELEISKKRQLIQDEYDRTIVDADKFFNSKTYDNALDLYRTASSLKPDEAYPKEMVARIVKLLSERSIVQINTSPITITSNTTHKFTFDPVPAKDRKSNYIFFRARNASKSEFKLIINYGKDQAKNGGVVVKVPAGEEINDFIVRISAQYKWFSEDNNWISFYPEGGDCEVNLMQISYSD